MRDVNVAVVGCGGIANGKHLPALANFENVHIVAFCDIIVERAKEAAEKYGEKQARVYESYAELMEKEKENVEIVYVLTPNKSHSPISCLAMETGYHVMCEKPMAKDVAGAQKMLETAKKTGKKLSIGYQNRFSTQHQYLKKVCENGELGEIYYAEALALRRRAVPTWGVFLNEEEQGGGPLIDIGTHSLDLVLYFMDNYEPEMVVGTTYKKLGSKENAANAWGSWDPKKFTVEDSAFGFIRFKNGATVVLKSSWALNIADPIEASVLLCGTEGGADEFDGLRINGEKYSKTYMDRPDVNLAGVAFYDGAAEKAQDVEAQSWLAHVLEDAPLVTKPEQALVVTKILAAIYESAETGKPVYL